MSTSFTGNTGNAEIYLGDYSQYRYTSRATMVGYFQVTDEKPPYDLGNAPAAPYNLKITEINVTFRDGVAKYEWVYEGVSGIFFDGTTKVLNLDAGTQQEPITMHPKINEFISKYSKGFSKGKIDWLLHDPTGQSQTTGLSSAGTVGNINPLLGVDAFLSPTASYSYEIPYPDLKSVPNIIDGLGKIASGGAGGNGPPDISSFFQGKKRNWLKSGVELMQYGTAVVVRTNYLLSGIGGWNEEIYK